MSTPKTRAYGAAKDHVLMQGKVSPEVRKLAQERANELGMSMSLYLEAALCYELDNHVLPPRLQEHMI